MDKMMVVISKLQQSLPKLPYGSQASKMASNDDYGVLKGVLQWDGNSQKVGRDEMEEIHICKELIMGASFNGGQDSWVWKGDKNNIFNVNSIRVLCSKARDGRDQFVMYRSKWVPIKANIYAWRTQMESIPTNEALAKRGCYSRSILCVLCGGEE
ncbi:hypothetical protein R6Q57_016905 [Mikania cordata]